MATAVREAIRESGAPYVTSEDTALTAVVYGQCG